MATAGPRYPTSNAVVNTGWTNPAYAYNADGVQLATGVPARNTAFYSDFGGFGFDALIPEGATIGDVTVEVYAKCSAAASQQSVRFGPMVSGVRHGTEQISTSVPASLTLFSQTWTGLTRNQLLDAAFKVRLGCYRTNTTSYTFSVDYLRVTVAYSVPAVVTGDGAGAAAGAGTGSAVTVVLGVASGAGLGTGTAAGEVSAGPSVVAGEGLGSAVGSGAGQGLAWVAGDGAAAAGSAGVAQGAALTAGAALAEVAAAGTAGGAGVALAGGTGQVQAAGSSAGFSLVAGTSLGQALSSGSGAGEVVVPEAPGEVSGDGAGAAKAEGSAEGRSAATTVASGLVEASSAAAGICIVLADGALVVMGAGGSAEGHAEAPGSSGGGASSGGAAMVGGPILAGALARVVPAAGRRAAISTTGAAARVAPGPCHGAVVVAVSATRAEVS